MSDINTAFTDEFGAAFHCTTCCPWYPRPCQGAFSAEFGSEMHATCSHPSCVVLDHEVGDRLVHGAEYPWTCLPWKADTTCCGQWGDYDDSLQKRAITLAWSTMKALTGGRVANGCTIVRPCLRDQRCDICQDGEFMLEPFIWNGQWKNWPKCRPTDCSCCDICEIEMPGRVAALLEVNIDGYRHDPRLFRIDNGNRLVRQDGCCFPGCQNMGAEYGAYGTFGVQYVPGIVPNAAGLWAVGVLACEYAKACEGGKCRLPTAVTSIARNGVSMEFPQGMFDQGTGIREVDAYVHSINPNRLSTPSKVWSPDTVKDKHRIRTGGPTGVWP